MLSGTFFLIVDYLPLLQVEVLTIQLDDLARIGSLH